VAVRLKCGLAGNGNNRILRNIAQARHAKFGNDVLAIGEGGLSRAGARAPDTGS
jgi:hypothetical protein